MRRAATWLVVGGLLLVGGIATVEILLRDGDDRAESRPARTSPQSLPAQLEAAGARGLLYVGVEEGGECMLRAIRLPSLVVESIFEVWDCQFAIGAAGQVASGSDCRGTSALATPDGATVDPFEGCAPAWKPDGELTFVRDGNVMTVPRSCTRSIDACSSVALSKQEIRRSLETVSGLRSPVLREIAWLDASRMAAILRDRGDFVVVFEGRRLAAAPTFGSGMLSRLVVDRTNRRIVVVMGGEIQDAFVLDAAGAFVAGLEAPVPAVVSVALSPDGAWAAAAGRASVVVFQLDKPQGRAFQLPFEAEALAWRGP